MENTNKQEINKEIISYVFSTYIQCIDKSDCGDQRSNYDWNDAKDLIEDILDRTKPKTFEEAAMPLIIWLKENSNPHTIALLTSNKAQLLESIKGFNL